MTPNQLIAHNDFVGAIHDELLDRNNLSLPDAYNDAVAWIAELAAQVSLLENQTSAGYCRRDTSQLPVRRKIIPAPVDDGDAWVAVKDAVND